MRSEPNSNYCPPTSTCSFQQWSQLVAHLSVSILFFRTASPVLVRWRHGSGSGRNHKHTRSGPRASRPVLPRCHNRRRFPADQGLNITGGKLRDADQRSPLPTPVPPRYVDYWRPSLPSHPAGLHSIPRMWPSVARRGQGKGGQRGPASGRSEWADKWQARARASAVLSGRC